MAPTPVLVLALLAVGSLPAAEARLVGSGDPGAHGLAVAGATGTGGVEANPQIDAWHAAEKKRIEEDCAERMRKLRAEKRRKLASIVGERQREADQTGRALQQAEDTVNKEVADLDKEKHEAEAEAAKLPPKEASVVAGKKVVQKWLDRIAELRRLIEQKKACVEELRAAERDLAEAKAKLAALQAHLADLMRQKAAAEAAMSQQEAELEQEQGAIASADDAIARAQARLDAALRALARAERDLAEHDAAPAPKR